MCPHEEKLTAWLLGDLEPEEQQAMTRHLETCAACRGVRDELARVLTPLRSGLEKDRRLRVEPLPQRAFARDLFRALWSAPHEGLKRVALFALSFGSLFALIGVVYHSSQRVSHEADAATYISFLQENQEPPPLTPEPELKSDAAAKLPLAEAAPDPTMVPAAPVAAPTAPAPERKAPSFPTLMKTDAVRAKTLKPFSAASAASAPAAADPAPERAAAKRERSKPANLPAPRTDATLLAQPVRLAATPPASTNVAATNAPTASAATNLPPRR